MGNSAVQTMQRSLVALKLETEEEITGEIKKQKTTALENVAGALSVSEASWNEVSDKITGDIKTFTEGSDKRFGDLYIAMADQRGPLDKKLATAVNDINDSIAKQSALQDERFSTSVKDI